MKHLIIIRALSLVCLTSLSSQPTSVSFTTFYNPTSHTWEAEAKLLKMKNVFTFITIKFNLIHLFRTVNYHNLTVAGGVTPITTTVSNSTYTQLSTAFAIVLPVK